VLTKKGCDFKDGDGSGFFDGYEKLDITEMSSCKMFFHSKVASDRLRCPDESVNCD
jgi:hypothetical protein